MRTLMLLFALSGCSVMSPVAACTGTATEVAPGLSCTDANVAIDYVAVLSARKVNATRRNVLLRDLGAHYTSDPAAVRADLTKAKDLIVQITGFAGMKAAERRSTAAWIALDGSGPLNAERYPNAGAILENRIAAWSIADEDKLVLTESDIEGWINYASLCREAQGADPLSLSVASRELLYRDLKRKFKDAGRAERIAMASMGPAWPQVERRWVAASYTKQQAWIKAAPFPPPMTASSMGYTGVLFEADLTPHAQILHDTLGPFKPVVP
ncbi:MAG: hypothetical protein AB8H79_26530 [Myxococcota bacterium]